MTAAELRAKWSHRLEEWRELGVRVDGERIAREILDDIESLEQTAADETLSLSEAAKEFGYHPDSIARLIRKGRVTNVGGEHRPRVLRRELAAVVDSGRPRSANLARGRSRAAVSAASTEIARDAIAGRIGRPTV